MNWLQVRLKRYRQKFFAYFAEDFLIYSGN